MTKKLTKYSKCDEEEELMIAEVEKDERALSKAKILEGIQMIATKYNAQVKVDPKTDLISIDCNKDIEQKMTLEIVKNYGHLLD